MNTHLSVSFAGKETLRCLALALKWMPMGQQTLSFDDEKDLTFIGLVCFLFKTFKTHMVCVSNSCTKLLRTSIILVCGSGM
jgi:hypothetical protein